MAPEERIEVYTTNQLHEAQMLIEYLSHNSIKAFLLNKMDSAYHFGDIEVLVLRDDVIRAKRLIEIFLANE